MKGGKDKGAREKGEGEREILRLKYWQEIKEAGSKPAKLYENVNTQNIMNVS